MTTETTFQPDVIRPDGASPVVLACEHASNAMPPPWGDLGLAPEARDAHIAWDPGALPVALHLSERLDAPLVAATASRLIYDINRPPDAPAAAPASADGWDVPGNADLTDADRRARAAALHDPFHAALAGRLADREAPVLVTVHSFTPVLAGRVRHTEIGLLHDADARLAEAMRTHAPDDRKVALNDPYGPEDGVTHTLRLHALPHGHLNVMLEIRSDLIDAPRAQAEMADHLADWLATALEDARCSA